MLYCNTIYCRVKTHAAFSRHFVQWSQQQISLDTNGYIRVNNTSNDTLESSTETLMIPLSSIQSVCDHPYAVNRLSFNAAACLSIISKLEDDQKIELELQFLIREEAHAFLHNLENMMTYNLQKLKTRAIPLIKDFCQSISISISRNMTELDENEFNEGGAESDKMKLQHVFEQGILNRQYMDKATYLSIDALLDKNHKDDTVGIWNQMDLDLPCLKIFMVCVGTRGDVQPFVHIAIQLLQDGHCIRFATHLVFRDYVLEAIPLHLIHRFEFIAIAGDPAALSAFCVKSKGQLLRPSIAVLRMIPSYSLMMKDIIQSVWTVVNDGITTTNGWGTPHCIIANPVVFVSHHIAQHLSIPLHIMFPQAVVPTKAFPHPYSSGVFSFDSNKRWNFENNYLSYTVVDRLVWHGMSSMINDLRVEKMDMAPVSNDFNPIIDMAIPFTLLSSNNLIPRPKDWPMHCSIAGSLKPLHYPSQEGGDNKEGQEEKHQNDNTAAGTVSDGNHKQEQYGFNIQNAISQESLKSFLQSKGGTKPIVYVGFGSMVMEDSDFEKIVQLLMEAAALCDCQIIVQSQYGAKIAPKTFEKLARHAERLSQNISDIELSYDASDDDDDTMSGYVSESSNSTANTFAVNQSGSTINDAYHHYIHTGSTLYVSEIIDFVCQSIVKDIPCKETMLSISPPTFATQEYKEYNRCRNESKDSLFSNNSNSGTDYEYCTTPLTESWCAHKDAFLITEDFNKLEHSWLFKHITAVISHGGQGTTITALRAGASVWIVYFFGDQIMIGNFAFQSCLGPRPASIESLSLVLCVDSINTLVDPLVRIRVEEFQARLEKEDGALEAKQLFYTNLPTPSYLCMLSMFFSKRLVLAEVYCGECALRMSREVYKCLHTNTSKEHHHIQRCTYFDWKHHLMSKETSTRRGDVDSTKMSESLLKPFKKLIEPVGMAQTIGKLYRKAKGYLFFSSSHDAKKPNHYDDDDSDEDGVIVDITPAAKSPTASYSQANVALKQAEGLLKLMEDISPINFHHSDDKKTATVPVRDVATYLLRQQSNITVDELTLILTSLMNVKNETVSFHDLALLYLSQL